MSAPKGRDSIAQGEALGRYRRRNKSPNGARLRKLCAATTALKSRPVGAVYGDATPTQGYALGYRISPPLGLMLDGVATCSQWPAVTAEGRGAAWHGPVERWGRR